MSTIQRREQTIENLSTNTAWAAITTWNGPLSIGNLIFAVNDYTLPEEENAAAQNRYERDCARQRIIPYSNLKIRMAGKEKFFMCESRHLYDNASHTEAEIPQGIIAGYQHHFVEVRLQGKEDHPLFMAHLANQLRDQKYAPHQGVFGFTPIGSHHTIWGDCEEAALIQRKDTNNYDLKAKYTSETPREIMDALERWLQAVERIRQTQNQDAANN